MMRATRARPASGRSSAAPETIKSYVVDGFPDHYFIDRDGKPVVADRKNASVESVIELLLGTRQAPKPEDGEHGGGH